MSTRVLIVQKLINDALSYRIRDTKGAVRGSKQAIVEKREGHLTRLALH